jgi:hypothetical protein
MDKDNYYLITIYKIVEQYRKVKWRWDGTYIEAGVW